MTWDAGPGLAFHLIPQKTKARRWRDASRVESVVEIVAFLVVLGEVEAGGFVGRGQAQAHHLIDHEKKRERTDDGHRPANAHADGLVDNLMPVSVDSSGRIGMAGSILAEDCVDCP